MNYSNFNLHSREGSDIKIAEYARTYLISIHAPAKGATLYPNLDNSLDTISIHAPAKGAT